MCIASQEQAGEKKGKTISVVSVAVSAEREQVSLNLD